ncbi:MarR family winged helix-turn-helix transcriptional regulator [Methylorubrum thiocyanatum]|uniref:MarR family transcriptional regulator for hemolysin n=1 Tax=Methylorubrum thiocyanatum TaxID=47958 RepID=A0AA40S0K5_9HYPH|nr:MarR family transcriptional regulator [Methylorubrum thiocyanatum]MBA8912395.1 MarR family transcriptional regulator for hemolysin [Methylorubrum thiocyanatum]GJE81188.1 Transcriptional regulator SlyA [Methylorubrum thiocyanatum]
MAAEGSSQLWLTYTHALLLSGRQWRRLANATTDAHGVSEAKALPLVLIGRLGGEPRQNALAEAVGIEGPSLVRLLDQLEAAGLVTRKEDPTDRRAKVLSLTDTGRSQVARIEADLDRLRKAVFSKVSASDLEASLRVFRAIQDRVGGPSETGLSGDRIAHGEAAE